MSLLNFAVDRKGKDHERSHFGGIIDYWALRVRLGFRSGHHQWRYTCYSTRGQWIGGRVEYGRERYPNTGMQYLKNEQLPRVLDGYYFVADDGSFCGLCVGMKVRIA